MPNYELNARCVLPAACNLLFDPAENPILIKGVRAVFWVILVRADVVLVALQAAIGAVQKLLTPPVPLAMHIRPRGALFDFIHDAPYTAWATNVNIVGFVLVAISWFVVLGVLLWRHILGLLFLAWLVNLTGLLLKHAALQGKSDRKYTHALDIIMLKIVMNIDN